MFSSLQATGAQRNCLTVYNFKGRAIKSLWKAKNIRIRPALCGWVSILIFRLPDGEEAVF